MELLTKRIKLEKDHPAVWALLGLCVIANALLVPVHPVLPRLASLAAYWLIINYISKGWRQLLLTIAVLLLVSFSRSYLTAADRAVKNASPTPIAIVADVNASVIPGGDPLEICADGEHMIVRVCYYSSEGVIVAAAHRSEISAGEYPVAKDGDHLPSEVSVIEDSNYGLVVTGHPPVPLSRPAMPLANTDEIVVGQNAEVLMGDEQPIMVEVKGYTKAKGVQQLVLLPSSQDPRLGPGCSGAPVVQNGKIIGFIAAGLMISKTPVALARLASEIYQGISWR